MFIVLTTQLTTTAGSSNGWPICRPEKVVTGPSGGTRAGLANYRWNLRELVTPIRSLKSASLRLKTDGIRDALHDTEKLVDKDLSLL